MNENILGYLCVIFGILVFIIRKYAVKQRMKLYMKIRKSKDQKVIENAEKSYRFGVIFSAVMLVLLGFWLIYRF
jgi:hypothetical protein